MVRYPNRIFSLTPNHDFVEAQAIRRVISIFRARTGDTYCSGKRLLYKRQRTGQQLFPHQNAPIAVLREIGYPETGLHNPSVLQRFDGAIS